MLEILEIGLHKKPVCRNIIDILVNGSNRYAHIKRKLQP